MNAWWAAAIVPALVAFVAIGVLRRTAWSSHLADHPNARSLHAEPTPRVGGLGLWLGAFPIVWWHADAALAAIFACALALAALSLADDVRSLPIEVRLPAHAMAAVVALLAMSQPPVSSWTWGWLAAIAVVAAITWSTNLFNFMDGSDGLAGGMAAIGFAAFALAAASNHAALALSCAAIASASLGFLAHNFPPARVFLGDCGSIPLGFLAGALGLYGFLAGSWGPWFPVLVFSPFVVDATVTLLSRAARGERVWLAHREHAYQRLVLSGWSRRRLAMSAYALMLATAASALVALEQDEKTRCAIIFVWAAIYALLAVAVGMRTRKK